MPTNGETRADGAPGSAIGRQRIALALLAGAAVFAGLAIVLPPDREYSLQEYREMGAARAYWAFSQGLVAPAVGVAAFVVVLRVGKRRDKLPPEASSVHRDVVSASCGAEGPTSVNGAGARRRRAAQ